MQLQDPEVCLEAIGLFLRSISILYFGTREDYDVLGPKAPKAIPGTQTNDVSIMIARGPTVLHLQVEQESKDIQLFSYIVIQL